MTTIVVTVAGSDPSGGAGIQADLKTFAALGAYGGAVITALTAQSTRGVQGVWPIDADVVAAQLESVLSDLDVAAVKTGMLGSAAVVAAVADAPRRHGVGHVVVDPVMVATSGGPLVDQATVEATRDLLLPLASVTTPNLSEAGVLLGYGPNPGVRTEHGPAEREMAAAGEGLRRLGTGAALITGGHLRASQSLDVLADEHDSRSYGAARTDTENTHGTGCTLSAALAVGLGRGLDLRAAVTAAKDYLTGALAAADTIKVGHGRGPVHHAYRRCSP